MINKETYEAMERIDKLSIELATAFIKSQNIIIAELQNDIECQKAEIEKLKSENLVLSQKRITMFERIEIVDNARIKAIREFAERLKKEIDMISYETGFEYQETIDTIDSLVKEMTEGENV